MSQALSVRRTHRYVGTYQHLDEWDDIGTINTLSSVNIDLDPQGDDACDPMETLHVVEVTTDQPEPLNLVCEALRASFTSAGCHHEWDCCGCRSYYASEIHHAYNNRFVVSVHSSRNY